MNENPPLDLFQKVYAVTSSDLSVDSFHSYEVFNLGHIWVSNYYDVSKIVKMQIRTQLINQKKNVERNKYQADLFPA